MHTSRKKLHILCQIEDHEGKLWDVIESRPTAHGWPVLLGRPAVRHETMPAQRKGGPQVIVTKELREYFERHRMHRSGMDLPLGQTVIVRLRSALGMNFIADRRRWWDQLRQELFTEKGPVLSGILSGIPYKTWTKQELRQFTEYVAAGKSLPDIAQIMGKKLRAVDAVRRKLLGNQKRQQPWDAETKKELLRLRKEGHSVAEIADIMRRSEKSIRHKLRILLPDSGRHGKIWTDAEHETLQQLVAQGADIACLMKTLGRSKHAIIVRITQHKMRKKSSPKDDA